MSKYCPPGGEPRFREFFMLDIRFIRENPDLISMGRWTAGRGRRAPGDNYYPVVVPIPQCSPTVIWELHRITLCDGGGNRKSYEAGKDFEGMLFQVLAQPDADCTPPRLLGVRFVAP